MLRYNRDTPSDSKMHKKMIKIEYKVEPIDIYTFLRNMIILLHMQYQDFRKIANSTKRRNDTSGFSLQKGPKHKNN